MENVTPTPRADFWPMLCAAAAVTGMAIVVILGADRSFWFDEVFTLGAAGIGRDPDWPAILKDVHPPTYVLMVRGLGATFGPDSFALRLVNLPGAIALIAAFALLWPVVGTARLAVVIALALVNQYAFQLAVDLRSYFLIYGVAFLGHAALFSELSRQRPRTVTLILATAALAALHFFGAAIGLSLLAISALGHIRSGRTGHAMAILVAGCLIFLAVLYWIFSVSDLLGNTGGNLWIRNSIAPYVDFLTWQLPLLVVAVAILVHARSGPTDARPSRPPLAILLPGAMVLIAALLISLHTPIVSARNLVVLVPGLILFAAASVPATLLADRRAWIGFLVIIVAFGSRSALPAVRDQQMIRWATETATPPECDGVPLYVMGPGIVDEYAQHVFAGGLKRPVRDLSEFDKGALPTDCRIIAMGFHEYGTLAQIEAYFHNTGIAVQAVPPPNPRLAETGQLTHGFVVRRTD